MKHKLVQRTIFSVTSTSYSDYESVKASELIESFINNKLKIKDKIYLFITNIMRNISGFTLGTVCFSLIIVSHFFRRSMKWVKKMLLLARCVENYWDCKILKKRWNGSDLQNRIIGYLTEKKCNPDVIGVFFLGVWNRNANNSQICVEHIRKCLASNADVINAISTEQIDSFCNYIIDCEKNDLNYSFIIEFIDIFSKVKSNSTTRVIRYFADKIPVSESQKLIHMAAFNLTPKL